ITLINLATFLYTLFLMARRLKVGKQLSSNSKHRGISKPMRKIDPGKLALQTSVVTYWMNNPKVVFLIHSSGSLVCASAKREEEIHKAVKKL
ncbi:MAG: hypothetical protein ACTSUS_02735, partial [Candidatus Freyarchaeota archaeon]